MNIGLEYGLSHGLVPNHYLPFAELEQISVKSIKILLFSFNNMYLKMLFAKCCLGINELSDQRYGTWSLGAQIARSKQQICL